MGRCPTYANVAVHPGIPPLIDFQVPAARAGLEKSPLTIMLVLSVAEYNLTLEIVTP
jgi:hypothetical protein